MSSETVSFPPEVVAAVLRHMNDDHAEDGLVICRAFGGTPAASSVTMTGCDSDGIDFTVDDDGKALPVRIPWAERVTTRPEIRVAVVRLYREACAVLGIEPRAEG